MTKTIKYCLLIFISALTLDVQATHLVGGSMSYEYLGQGSNGRFRYRLTINMYRDCFASNVPFDQEINVYAHHNNTNRNLYETFVVPLLSQPFVDPPSGGSDCSFKPNVCLQRGFYQSIIEVDASTIGYHLVFQRCCRNTQQNLLDDLGQTYYAFIPPTSIRNNSPVFTGVPAPYICLNDLVSIDNIAKDADGDSLVYSLEIPWSGGTASDPMPTSRNTWPQIPNFNPVIYKNGFTVANPFGTGGTSNINPFNGLTNLLSNRQGRFSIAVEVSEYRNGVFLSKIRLDIQMIVIQCPPNETPVISAQGNNFSFEVEAGRQICFNITATDPDNDAISLRGTGSIFDLPNKPIFNQGSGASPLTTQFCWTPTCDQGTNFPYVFNIEAKDNGCPPKTKVVAVTIRVKPFVGANNISGPAVRCVNATGFYEANGESDSRYDWQIIPANAGNIIQGQGSKSIEVVWVLSGNHRIEVVETSKNNCKGLSVQRIVQVLANPNIPLIEGQDTVCEFSTNNLYRTNVTPNWIYSWIVSGGSIVGAANQNVVNVNWGASGKGSVKLIQTNELGCASDTAEMLVFIDNASVGAINGTPSVCPNVKGVRYLIRDPQPWNTYVWTVSGGTQEWTGTSSEIKVNWGGIGKGYVEAYSISKYGCVGNPFRLNVDINHALQGMTPVGPDTLCENTALVSYYVDYTNRSEYFWSITNGVIVSGNGSNAVVVSWGASGIGRLSVYETSYDSVNNLPCISQPLSLNVYLAPYPKDTSVIGLREVCQSPLPVIYSVVGLPNSGFFWTFSGPEGIVGQGSSQIQLVLNTPGTYNLRFIETSAFGCEGEPVNISIIVHPKPTTKGITGEKTVCYPNYSNYEYLVQGFSNSRFVWQLDGGIINSGQNSNTINANWTGQQINQISVYEISSFGCIGDTLTSEVFADNPELEMLVVTVGMPEDNRMEVKWELKNAPRYDADIQLFRRDVMNNIPTSWTNRAKLNGNVSEYRDRPLNTNRNPYEYYVSGRNLCGDTILSEIHRSVLITGKRGEDGYDVYVDWTRYQGWQNGVSEYVLYRKNGNEEYLPYYNGGLDTTAYSNEGAESFKQCFRAKAKESAGNSEESWSNEVCFIFDPILWIPSAFTPNNDRLNQQFEWVWASIKTFHLEIFNRWGEKIYETKDYTKYWDGTYKGKQVQEGVYAYLLRYSGGDDKLVVKSGNITVMR